MVQTSNLLFPGPGKSKMVQAGKKQNGSDFQFAFSRGKAKCKASNLESNLWGQIAFSGLETSSACEARAHNLLLVSLLLFPGPGKSKLDV